MPCTVACMQFWGSANNNSSNDLFSIYAVGQRSLLTGFRYNKSVGHRLFAPVVLVNLCPQTS